MINWQESRLGAKADIYSGFAFKSNDMTEFDSGFPVIKIAQIQNKQVLKNVEEYFPSEKYTPKLKRYLLKKDDILIAMTGAGSVGKIGKMHFVDRDFLINQRVAIVRVNTKELCPNYLYYFLSQNYIEESLYNIGLGAGQPNISPADIGRIDIYVPPLPEQQRIASILSAYDELIENNNKRISILERMAEQIYKEWFVRMRFPGYENVEFEKGVPKGWLKELGNYIKVVKGKSYTGEEINEIGEGKPFVNLKSFNRGGGYRYDGIKFYTGKYHEKQVVREGDIVMAVTDMTQDRAVVGRVARIPKTEFSEMIISLDSAKIVPDKKLPNAFFYATLRFGFFGNTIKEFANGSNVLHLKPELAYQMKSIIPDDEAIIKKFEKLIEPYFNLIDNLNLENQNLKKTRDLLLPRLISGKLRVKDAKPDQKI